MPAIQYQEDHGQIERTRKEVRAFLLDGLSVAHDEFNGCEHADLHGQLDDGPNVERPRVIVVSYGITSTALAALRVAKNARQSVHDAVPDGADCHEHQRCE